MDMDEDFMGDIGFALTPEESALVNRAISRAASMRGDDFANINPLLAIMQWWQDSAPDGGQAGGTPEARLTEACRRFLAAHPAEDGAR